MLLHYYIIILYYYCIVIKILKGGRNSDSNKRAWGRKGPETYFLIKSFMTQFPLIFALYVTIFCHPMMLINWFIQVFYVSLIAFFQFLKIISNPLLYFSAYKSTQHISRPLIFSEKYATFCNIQKKALKNQKILWAKFLNAAQKHKNDQKWLDCH